MDYLDYNQAIKVPYDIEGFPVYLISSDANNNPFKIDSSTLKGVLDSDEVIQEKLNGLKRLQVFKRISHRAGLAAFNTRK